MSTHLTEQDIDRFRRRVLNSDERQRIDRHVISCDSCLLRALAEEDLSLAYRDLTDAFLVDAQEPAFHLSRKEIEQYFSGTAAAADRIICQSHLEICADCGAVLGSLGERQHQSGLAAPPAPLLLRNSVSSWRRSFTITKPRVVFAAIILATLVLSVVIWQRRSHLGNDLTARSNTPPSLSSRTHATPEAPPAVFPATQRDNADVQPGALAQVKDNGRIIQIDRNGKLLGLDELPKDSHSFARTALAAEKLAKPAVLNRLTAPQMSLLNPEARESSLELSGPAGVVVMSARPTLRWKSLTGATGYTVSIFDPDFNLVARGGSKSQTLWSPPTLRRGIIYSWEVVALLDGREVRAPVPPSPKAQFKVLEGASVTELNNLKRVRPISHFGLGLAYLRFGLLNEAEHQFRILSKQNPKSPIVTNLLRTIHEWRKR